MSHEKTEVGATLKLDDHASHVLNHVKEGFEKVGEKVKETTHEVMGFAKQVAATAIGFNFMNGVDSIKEFGHEVVNASLAAKAQEKSLTGVLLMTDTTGKSMKELSMVAHEVHERFENLGMTMGSNSEEIEAAFTQVAERSSKSTEEVQKFTEKLFFAGKAVSGGMGALSQGFSMIEMGNVRASNAVVRLITAQHLLAGNAKQVAKQMQKMTDVEKIKLAEKAVEGMAEKMKPKPGADLGYKAVIAAMGNIREKMFQIVGDPIVAALSQQLNRLHRFFLENQHAIEHWAHVVGEKAGEWIKAAADKMQEGFEYIKTHAEEIKAAIVEAWDHAKMIVQFILDNKEAIAVAFGAKKAKDMAGAVMGMAGSIAGPGAGIGANTLALGALTVAIASWTMAIHQAELLGKENNLKLSDVIKSGLLAMATGHLMGGANDLKDKGGASQDAAAKKERLDTMAGSTEGANSSQAIQGFAKMRAEYQALAQARGEDQASIDSYIATLDKTMNAHRQAASELDQASSITDVSGWTRVYNEAAKKHDTATMQYAADLMAQSKDLQFAFIEAGGNIEGGIDQLVEMLKKKSTEAANLMANFGAGLKEAEKPAAPVQNFSGGQTFNIKQDFRDQDPDRIALIFRNDILRSAENRRSARTGTPFGL